MPVCHIDDSTFSELHDIDLEPNQRGKIPIPLTAFTPENQKLLHAIASTIKPDYNAENLFAAEVDYGTIMKLLGFSLAIKDNELCLLFGSFSESTSNVVAVEYENGKLTAGAAKVQISAQDPNKEKSPATFTLTLTTDQEGTKTKWRIPLFGNVKDDVTFDDLEDASDLEELASFFKPFGGLGCKLVDFTRPYISQAQATKNRLKAPIILDVVSWTLQEPHPEWGECVLFDLDTETVPSAMLDTGEILEKPSGVFVNARKPGLGKAAQMILNEVFAKKALKNLEGGGKVQIWITAINSSEPERKTPTHQIKIIPASQSALAVSSAPTVEANVVSMPNAVFETVAAQATANGNVPLAAMATSNDEDDDDIPESFASFA